MKNLFNEAHKLTRKMVEKYGVDYQAQFAINVSYLAETKEALLDKEIAKEIKELGYEMKIERANEILNNKTIFNEELVNMMYSENRRTLKANNLWDSKTMGIKFEERYLGNKNIEIANQKLWIKEDKIRVYFDLVIDKVIVNKGHYIKIK